MEKKVTLPLSPLPGLKRDTKTVYIYALKDPRTQAIRYVGSTTNPEVRFNAHQNAQTTPNVREWVSELRQLGLKPTLEILEEASSDERYILEELWIVRCQKLETIPLLNKIFSRNPRTDIDPAMFIGRRMDSQMVQQIRLALGLNQSQLSQTIGMAQEHVCRVENGKRPVPVKMASKIADLIGLSICPSCGQVSDRSFDEQ